LYARLSGCDGSRGPTGRGARWRLQQFAPFVGLAPRSISAPARRALGLPWRASWIAQAARPARAPWPSSPAGALQVGHRQHGHLEEQVDAIEQRAGELAPVAGDLLGRASAAPVRVAVEAAGAGVHRRDQLEAGRNSARRRRGRW
jgi:hypothetical protein